MWGSVGIPTAPPGFGDIRGRTKSTCVPGVGTETQWDVLRQSRRCKFPGAGKSRLDHCPLLLSISHGSAQTAGSGVVGATGEGMGAQRVLLELQVKVSGSTAGASGMSRASSKLSLCCAAALPSPAQPLEPAQRPCCSIPAPVLRPRWLYPAPGGAPAWELRDWEA